MELKEIKVSCETWRTY